MVKNIRPLIDKIDSAQWLNAVRNQMGSDYRNRIPEATQANLADTVANLWNNPADRNIVENALVNQLAMVVFRNQSWQNPLAIYKMGMLPEGDTIEEVMVGLIPAIDYDADRDELEKEIFGNHDLEVQSRFHKRNRKDRYAFTLNLPGLRSALLGNQLGSYATAAMAAPQTSDQFDEYLLMTQLFAEFDRVEETYFNINVPDVSDQGSDSADSRFLLRRLREMKNTLPFISRMYNPAGMPVAANPNELVLFTTAASDAAMDVEALAAAFNLDKAEFAQRKIVLPTQHFGIDGVQAILTTDKFFVVADNLIQSTSQFNPAKMTTNFWLHHWQTISASPFAPLVMFNSLRESTTISISDGVVTDISAFVFTDQAKVVATNLKRGTLYDVAVTPTTNPAGKVAALSLSIEGNESSFTYITNNGDIYIGPDEAATSIVVTATSIDNGYSESVTKNIVGDLIVPQGPNLTSVPDSDSDGLNEVVPEALTKDADTDMVTIPTVVGVQYRKETVNVANGTQHLITAETDFDAVARAGFELSGGPYTWTFNP